MSTSPTTAGTEMPSGTVTVLFTDIEGSSRLEQRVGTIAYATLRERHRELLRGAFVAEGGREQGTAGDSFFVVFPTAAGAIRAAVASQRSLAAEPWPEDATIRVRIGIHSGEVALAGRDYVGIDINRAARIEAAAHGGQVVASESARALAAGSLEDPSIGFVDLGLNKLKDFEPIHLHQVTAPGIARDFPPLRSLDARFINLPPPVTSFIGRAREVAEVSALLGTTRLLTLTGPGGTGKTRLSIAAAQASLDRYGGGAAWVGLSPIGDAGRVPSAIATVLGVIDEGIRDLVEAIADRIAEDRLLLVLDNFEHVVEAAWVVGALQSRCPNLTILATSREILHLAGEREYPVPPFALPDPGSVDPEALARNEAVALFVERAQAVRPDFRITAENAGAIAAICARLDGLPLAIELAAARVRILAPAALRARLEQSIGILGGGAHDLPERQQTLRGAIAWSYDLLGPAERSLFDRLAVFAGGWSFDAATAVCDPDGALGLDPFDGLTSLVEKSLVRSSDGPDGEPRFRLLQTIREFGLERLAATGELAAVRDRHLDWIADLAVRAERELVGPKTRAWLDRLELEHDNIGAALRWARESGRLEIGLLTAGRLWRYWHQRGHLGEGLATIRELLECPAAGGRTAGRAKALNGAGGLAYWQNDFPTATGFYTEQLAIYQELDDKAGLAEAYYNLGFIAAIPGDHELAIERYERALGLWRELGDEPGTASGLLGLGLVLFLRHDLERARAISTEAATYAERVGDHYRWASALGILSRVDQELEDYDTARSLAMQELMLFAEVGDPTAVAMTFDDLGELALATGDAALALRFAGASAAIRDKIEGGAPPTLVLHGDYVGDARAALAPGDAAAAWQAGRAMDQESAVRFAREVFEARAGNAGAGGADAEAGEAGR